MYAHETATKYYNIPAAAMDGSIEQFVEQVSLLTGGANLSPKQVEVRFVYRHEEIVSSIYNFG